MARAAAEQSLNSAAQKLEFNDRIGALREWEKALKNKSLPDSQRRVLLYNCVAVHAAMGDLELAQVCPLIRLASATPRDPYAPDSLPAISAPPFVYC